MIRNRKFLGYGRFNFGYELGKKFLVRVILSYGGVVFGGVEFYSLGHIKFL